MVNFSFFLKKKFVYLTFLYLFGSFVLWQNKTYLLTYLNGPQDPERTQDPEPYEDPGPQEDAGPYEDSGPFEEPGP